MDQRKNSKTSAKYSMGKKLTRVWDLSSMPKRVAPPSMPICFENPNFKLTIEQIFSIFSEHQILNRIFLSGGCLSRSYVDPSMSEGHRKVFGDVDFKLPSCTHEELGGLLSYLDLFQSQSGVVALENVQQYHLPLVDVFHHLLNAGATLKKC